MGQATRAVALCLSTMLAALVASGSNQPAPGDAPDPRLRAIPPEAIKMMPAEDDHPPVLHSAEFEKPVPLPGPVNTAGAEDSPFMTADGREFYLFFTPDVRVPPEKQLLDGVTGIYLSVRRNGVWGMPTRVVLQDPGKLALDGAEFVHGDEMWFASAREGYTGVQLFRATRVNGRWSSWRHAGDDILRKKVGEMHISPDGRDLYFHSERPGGIGGLDIWVMRRTQGGWGEPELVDGVNTEGSDGWPALSPDGGELWITRTHRGSPALFRSRRSGVGWSTPELIVSSFAGEATIDPQGNLYFTHHFFKSGKMIEADIYMARRRQPATGSAAP